MNKTINWNAENESENDGVVKTLKHKRNNGKE